MTGKKGLLLLVALLMATGVSTSLSATGPANSCIMIPEIVNGRIVGQNIQGTGYEPESCITLQKDGGVTMNS